jgi:hypothetical protein
LQPDNEISLSPTYSCAMYMSKYEILKITGNLGKKVIGFENLETNLLNDFVTIWLDFNTFIFIVILQFKHADKFVLINFINDNLCLVICP